LIFKTGPRQRLSVRYRLGYGIANVDNAHVPQIELETPRGATGIVSELNPAKNTFLSNEACSAVSPTELTETYKTLQQAS